MKKILFFLPLFVFTLFSDENEPPPVRRAMDYHIYAELLFLQPNGSNLIYAMQANPQNPQLTVPLVEANWFDHEINPAYHPAFEVGTVFAFKNREMNLIFNWERLSGTDKNRLSVPSGEAMVGPLFDIGPDAEVFINAKGKMNFRFDLVNSILEKRFFSEHGWALNFCVGASFLRIREKLKDLYFNDGASIARIIRSSSEFIGGGTLFGLNFDYFLFKNFRLTGDSLIYLIMGQLKNNTSYQSFAPALATMGIPQPNQERLRIPTRTQLIPSLEEKIGFAYDFLFHCNSLSVEAGYQFQIFLNAIQSLDMTVIVNANDLPFPSTVGYYAQGFERTLSNFMLTGPYLKVDVCF